MTFNLKGKIETAKPTEIDIRKELESLLKDEIEFVVLESKKGFIQSKLNKGGTVKTLSIEVNQASEVYTFYGKDKFSLEEAYEIFKDYLNKGRIDLNDGTWVALGWTTPNNLLNKTSLQNSLPIFLILYLVISITIWVTNKGEAGLWAFLGPLFALALVVTGLIVTEFGSLHLPNRIIQILSKQIGMPAMYLKGRSMNFKGVHRIELKPGSKASHSKLIFLKIVGFSLSMISLALCYLILFSALGLLFILIFDGPSGLAPIREFFRSLLQ